MGLTLALLAHIAGTAIAAVLVYFAAPYITKATGTEEVFNYIVLYSLLAIWSYQEAQKIEKGEHSKANELEKILSKDEE